MRPKTRSPCRVITGIAYPIEKQRTRCMHIHLLLSQRYAKPCVSPLNARRVEQCVSLETRFPRKVGVITDELFNEVPNFHLGERLKTWKRAGHRAIVHPPAGTRAMKVARYARISPLFHEWQQFVIERPRSRKEKRSVAKRCHGFYDQDEISDTKVRCLDGNGRDPIVRRPQKGSPAFVQRGTSPSREELSSEEDCSILRAEEKIGGFGSLSRCRN